MYLATAAAILLLANAAYVHSECAVTPDPTTGAIIIPTDWTEIGANAFYKCATIKSVVIPTNIIFIRANAFSYTKITKIEIPRSVQIIDDAFAFAFSQLEEVVFQSGSQLHTIGQAVSDFIPPPCT